jgi:hypothetical protein
MFHTLVQRYAMRAREFSDAVAALGHQARLGPEACADLLEDIRTRREACTAAAEELDQYLLDTANPIELLALSGAGASACQPPKVARSRRA